MVTITIPGQTLPSWNKLYAGKHWAVRKKMADEWHMLVWLAVKQQKVEKIKYNGRTLDIYITCYFASRRLMLDPDNICMKMAIDGLKEIVIEDDDAKHIKRVSAESKLDIDNPRTEIRISWI